MGMLRLAWAAGLCERAGWGRGLGTPPAHAADLFAARGAQRMYFINIVSIPTQTGNTWKPHDIYLLSILSTTTAKKYFGQLRQQRESANAL